MPIENPENNSNNLLVGLPWWVRGLAIVGFPMLAAAYLTWIIGQVLPLKVDNVSIKLDQVHALEVQHHSTFLSKWDSQEEISKQLIAIALASCINAAKDETSRNRCLGR